MRQSWLARTVRLTVLLLSVDLALAMRIVLQRVKSASVTVEDAVVSSINRGVVALVGLREGDTTADLEYCAKKLCAAKLWANEEGKGWRKAARQLDYEVLLVSRRVETSYFNYTTVTYTSEVCLTVAAREPGALPRARFELMRHMCY